MTPADPPSGRALSDERLAEIRVGFRTIGDAVLAGQEVDHAPLILAYGLHVGELLNHIDALAADLDAAQEALAASRVASDAWWTWKRASLYDAGPDGQLWKDVNLTQMALERALVAARPDEPTTESPS